MPDPSELSSLFPGRYEPSADQVSAAWEKAVIVLDTNALLNLYKVSRRKQIQAAYEDERVANRIWAPYQVALEFEEARGKVLRDEWKKINDLTEALASAENDVARAIEQLRLQERGVEVDPAGLKAALATAIGQIREQFDVAKQTYVNPQQEDPVRRFVGKLLQGRIGPPPSSQKELDALYAEGAVRYSLRVPPGFADKKVDSVVVGGLRYERQFGDLLLWTQILKHFEGLPEGSDLIFITADSKEDWWQANAAGKQIPHPELADEFRRRAHGGTLLMYSPEDFLKIFNSQLSTKVSDAALEELKFVETEPTVAPQDVWRLMGSPLHTSSATDGLRVWVATRLHATLTDNPSPSGPNLVPKRLSDRREGGFHVIDLRNAGPDLLQRQSVALLAADMFRIESEGRATDLPQTTFVLGCSTSDFALSLARELQAFMWTTHCVFLWTTSGSGGLQGARLADNSPRRRMFRGDAEP